MKSCAMYGIDPNQSNYTPEIKIQPPLKLLWKFSSPKSSTKRTGREHVYFDTPLEFGSRVFTCKRLDGTRPIIYCLDANDGKEIWTLENDIVERITISCVSRGVLILAGEGKERIRGIDIESGQVLWSNHNASVRSPQFCLDSCNVVFCGRTADSVLCGILQPETGEIIWSRKTYHSCRSAAACNAGLLLIEERGSKEFNGIVCCDASKGAQIWERDFSDAGRHKELATGEIVPGRPGSVVSSGNLVYCNVNVGKSNQLYCLDAKNGDFVWQLECAPGPMQPIVVGDELCWIIFGNEYYRVDAQTGKILVHTKLPGEPTSYQSIGVVANGYLWNTSIMEFRALTVKTSELVWSWKNRALLIGPTVGEDRLYAVSFPPASQILCFGCS